VGLLKRKALNDLNTFHEEGKNNTENKLHGDYRAVSLLLYSKLINKDVLQME
jgi:hypothetical protein